MFYAEEFSNPTRALSPRQLPTDPVHAVPTREYQSDPSSRMLLRGHRLCCPKQNLLKAHQRERVPATPPVDSPAMPERRAAVKNSLRARQKAARPWRLRAVLAGSLSRRAAPAGTLHGPLHTSKTNQKNVRLVRAL